MLRYTQEQLDSKNFYAFNPSYDTATKARRTASSGNKREALSIFLPVRRTSGGDVLLKSRNRHF